MSTEFSADVEAILRNVGSLGEAVDKSRRLASDFEDEVRAYRPGYGEPGVGDPLYDAVVPRIEEHDEALRRAVGRTTEVFLNLIQTLVDDTAAVKRPQDDAVQDIARLGGEDGARR